MRKKISVSGLYKNKPPYVGGTGISGAKIALVGMAPGKEEEEKGLPFVGRSGKKLSELLEEAGINFSECYRTNVSKYRPPLDDMSRLDEVGIDYQEQVNNLFKELREVKPNIAIALGEEALKALTGRKGITKYRGSILPALYGDFKVLPTIHPSALLRAENPWERDQGKVKSQRSITPEIVIVDLIKAKKESNSKEFSTPERKLEIITSAHQLYKFLKSYDSKEPSIDIETFKCIPSCIAIAFTPWHSCSIPLLPIPGCRGELRLTPSEYIAIWKELGDFLNREDISFIGQNIKFDIEKLIAPAKLLHPFVRNKVAADTQVMMGILYPELPKKLEFSTSVLTNEPFYKDEGKQFNPKKDPYETFLLYNAKDSAVTKEVKIALDKELSEVRRSDYVPRAKADGDTFTLKDFYYNYMRELHDFYMDMEAEGLNVDIARRNELTESYKARYNDIHKETVELIGTDYNPRSYVKDVPKIMSEILKLPARKGYGEEELVSLMGNHTEKGSVQEKVIKNILSERQIFTNAKYLEASPDADNIMRSSWNQVGTETGRTSTSDLEPPLRPFGEKPHKMGLPFQTLPKHGPFAKAIRGIFVAPEGYVFLERDYSQAEARITLLLANDPENLKLFDTSDIHRLTASWIFGGSPQSRLGEEGYIGDDKRFIGKVVRHAGNYGMGKHRLMLDANATALKFGIDTTISESEAAKVLDIFHKRTPKIRTIFQREVRDIVQRSRMLWNPYGRLRQFFGYLKDEEVYAQLPQSTVPDSLKMAGLRIRKRAPWMRFCMESHDSFVWKIRENRLDEALKISKEEMEVPIDFKYCSLQRGCITIPTEASIGTRLSELRKVV